MELIEEFEAARPRLLSVAHRMLGSVHDAEDAVQTAWLRAAATPVGTVSNPVGWLITVTARVCLDQLRTRRRRGEFPLPAGEIPDERLAVDEELIRRDEVSRAVMVLLERLSPSQRIAFVMHDLFTVPFAEVAAALDTTTANAKKHASRARARLQSTPSADQADRNPADREVAEAFLTAAMGGDMKGMLALMAPDCIRVADASLLPPAVPTRISGARAIAQETSAFVDRIRMSVPLIVNGRLMAVIAPGGHALAGVDIRAQEQQIESIVITAIRRTDRLAAAHPLLSMAEEN